MKSHCILNRKGGAPRRLVTSLIIVSGAIAANAQLSGNLFLDQASQSGNGTLNSVYLDNPAYSTGFGRKFTVSDSAWDISSFDYLAIVLGDPTVDYNSAYVTVSKFSGVAPSAQHDPTTISTGSDIVYSALLPVQKTFIKSSMYQVLVDVSGAASLQGLAHGDYVVSIDVAGNDANGSWFVAENSARTATETWQRNPADGYGFGWANWSPIANESNAHDAGIGINGTVNTVPEPSALAILGLGLPYLFRRRRA
ncbi:MAG: PEP-CTERM sorting domain-containing protein [Armatimonadetes bacterium]|nr:PEP-CTERM sorting domain-containing protein [Armatimonadota bacterium]